MTPTLTAYFKERKSVPPEIVKPIVDRYGERNFFGKRYDGQVVAFPMDEHGRESISAIDTVEPFIRETVIPDFFLAASTSDDAAEKLTMHVLEELQIASPEVKAALKQQAKAAPNPEVA